jgi:hypothetical protein
MVLAVHGCGSWAAFIRFGTGHIIAGQAFTAGIRAAAGHAFGLTGRCRHLAVIADTGQPIAAFGVGIAPTVQFNANRGAGFGGRASLRAAAAIRYGTTLITTFGRAVPGGCTRRDTITATASEGTTTITFPMWSPLTAFLAFSVAADCLYLEICASHRDTFFALGTFFA